MIGVLVSAKISIYFIPCWISLKSLLDSESIDLLSKANFYLPLAHWCCECYFWILCGHVRVCFRSIGAAGWCLRSRPVKDLADWKNTLMKSQPTSEPVLRYASHCNSSAKV